MKMKNYLKVFFSLVLLISLGSCTSEKEENVSGQGSIMIDLYGAQNETYIEGWEKKTSNLLIYKRLCKI